MSSSTQWLQVGTMVPANSPYLHGLGLQQPREMEQPGPGASLKVLSCSDILSGPHLGPERSWKTLFLPINRDMKSMMPT